MSSEPPTFVAYPRTGALGGVPSTTLRELRDVATARKWTMVSLLFGLAGVAILLGYATPSGGFQEKRPLEILGELWFPMVIAQALAAYLHYFALGLAGAAQRRLRDYQMLLAWATSLVPFGSLFFPLATVLLCDQFFKRRGIVDFFLSPKDPELVQWVETFGDGEPEPVPAPVGNRP